MLPTASRTINRIETMDSIEVLLTKKLDELESKMFFLENPKEQHFPHPRATSLRSKLFFLKNLLTAEIGGNNDAGRLNHIDSRISAMEFILSSADQISFSHQSSAKIRSKIAFTKSLLANEDHSENLSSLSARIAAVEEVFVHSCADGGTQPSSSSTSCHTEELGEEEAVAWSLRKKIKEIEKESNGDDYDDAQRKIEFLRPLLVTEFKWKGEEKAEELDGFVKRFSTIGSEFTDRNSVVDDTVGGNLSTSCSCTSSCFDGLEEKQKQTKEEDIFVSSVTETGQLCSAQTEDVMEGKPETGDSEGRDGERKFSKLRAMGTMVGVFAVAAVGVAVSSFFSEKGMVYLMPT